MQRMLLTAILFLETACAQMPAAPQGNTCIVDVVNYGADCVSISTAVHLHGDIESIRTGSTSFVQFPQMDNWVAFDPVTWSHVQTYIGDLKLLAQKQCGTP